MKKKFKLGIIGAGFMATAIIDGVISSNVIKKNELTVYDINDAALEKIREKGIFTSLSNSDLVKNSEYILFAVKPQSFDQVARSIEPISNLKVISIMAGVKKAKIKRYFENSSVARCMPNTPCSIKSGAIGADLSDFNDADADFIQKILSSIGVVVQVEEEKLGAVTAISGSSPAYFYAFVNGIIESGIKLGLSESDAKTLAVNTLIGSGKMIINNPDKQLSDLINSVCSKGGTTIEAVKVFESENLDGIIDKAMKACFNRSKELEDL